MNKKLLVATLAVASLFFATGSFAVTTTYCTSGANLRFIGVGSSAQINALAYAAVNLLQTDHGTGTYALISFGGSTITDLRPKTGAKTDTGITTFVAYDPSATSTKCDAYVYYQTDSGVGVKDFFAYTKFTATNSTVASKKNFVSIGAASATLPSAPIAEGNKIPGLADGCFISGSPVACDSNGVPPNIYSALNTSPETYVNQAVPPAAPAYCGNVSTVLVTSQFYCYFNAAGTDIRPEDALYATTRALAAYNGIAPPATSGSATTTLTGEGYGTTSTKGCTADSLQPTAVGCGIWDSFAQGAQFYVLKFALGGADPIASGTAPTYTTVSVGAAPIVVIAGDEDSSNLGNKTCNGTYCYNDINRQTLSQVFSGWTQCVADLSTSAAPGTLPSGAAPLQVLHRESLSGTYNTFEFTGVNTQAGGPGYSNAGKYTPVPNSHSGQEQFNDPAVFNGYTGSADCSYSSGEVVGTHPGYPNANCFNPRYTSYDGTDIFSGKQCQGHAAGVAPGLPVHLRTIGTGQEVKAVVGSLNNTTASPVPNTNVFNPIGYSFWSYANLNPMCSAVSDTSCTGHYLAHYLTVDGIDPLFQTEGGQYDPAPYTNPSPFNPPVCSVASGTQANCNPILFPHIYDGKYPLWSLLRTVTLAPVTGKVVTPEGVLDMVASEEVTSANNTLSDYVPFLKHVCPPGEVWSQPNGPCVSGSTTTWTGDLNLLVFRSHFQRTGAIIKPANGHFFGSHQLCPTTEINIQGGNKSSSTCFVDFGNDVGGSVIPVQKDFDFIVDFSTEEYGLSQ